MLNLLGSVCILGGGVLAVLQQLRERRRRRDALADMMGALRQMAEEIRLLRTPMPRLLAQAAEGRGADAEAFFLRVSDALRQGEATAQSWRQAAAELPLTQRDCETVAAIGKCLQGDEEKACNGISLAMYELAKSAERLDAQWPEETKRTTALYLSGAALLVILLL